MKRKKKKFIHKINLQNKYAYIVKEITLIHKCQILKTNTFDEVRRVS